MPPKRAKADRKVPADFPPHADYSDEISDQQIDKIRALVPESEYAEAEEEGKSIW